MTSLRFVLSLLLLALLMPTASVARAQTGDRVVNIAMEDQFRNRRETGVYRGEVVVLVYAERKGAEAALELGRRLHVLFHPTAETAPAIWATWATCPPPLAAPCTSITR